MLARRLGAFGFAKAAENVGIGPPISFPGPAAEHALRKEAAGHRQVARPHRGIADNLREQIALGMTAADGNDLVAQRP